MIITLGSVLCGVLRASENDNQVERVENADQALLHWKQTCPHKPLGVSESEDWYAVCTHLGRWENVRVYSKWKRLSNGLISDTPQCLFIELGRSSERAIRIDFLSIKWTDKIGWLSKSQRLNNIPVATHSPYYESVMRLFDWLAGIGEELNQVPSPSDVRLRVICESAAIGQKIEGVSVTEIDRIIWLWRPSHADRIWGSGNQIFSTRLKRVHYPKLLEIESESRGAPAWATADAETLCAGLPVGLLDAVRTVELADERIVAFGCEGIVFKADRGDGLLRVVFFHPDLVQLSEESKAPCFSRYVRTKGIESFTEIPSWLPDEINTLDIHYLPLLAVMSPWQWRRWHEIGPNATSHEAMSLAIDPELWAIPMGKSTDE